MKNESFVTKLSFIKDNIVSIVQNAWIPESKVIMHNRFIHNNLLKELAILYAFVPIIVKFKCLLKLLLIVDIIFVCLNNRHASLARLNNLKLKIPYKVVSILSWDIATNGDSLPVFIFVSGVVVISWKCKESVFGVFVHCFCRFYKLVQCLNIWNPDSIKWCWC